MNTSGSENIRKIYIACPANVATGGPEALHQLCFNLRTVLGEDAIMFYYQKNYDDPVHPTYKSYQNTYSSIIQDHSTNILIVPEVEDGLVLLNQYRNIKKFIWFLSIDNYYLFKNIKKSDFLLEKFFNKTLRILGSNKPFELTYENISKKYPMRKDPRVMSANLLITQSFRGKIHIHEKTNKEPLYLSDYLNDDFFLITQNQPKKNVIAYNPSKGLKFTKKIIENSTGLTFTPIKNMTRDDVVKNLLESKVYIDFGNHPGKDRFPREASILGCCIITGKKGCAHYYEDIPINDEYKFEEKEDTIPLIIRKIEECITHYDKKIIDFENYRLKIMNEKNQFINDMRNIFANI